MEKPLRIKLHILSPVHIGCDDVYEPTSFVIDEERKILVEFDPIDFIANLDQKQRNEFAKLCSSDNLLAIYKFVKTVYNYKNPLREVGLASGLVAHYKTVLAMSSYDNKKIINQFTIYKTSYNPQTNEVYIPGTTVKGSLRTAYLSYLAIQKGISERKEKAKELEIELLEGKFETDPFRLVKVSDFHPLESVKTKIVYGVNKKKRVSDRETKAATGPQQIFEVIEPGSVFEGAVNINKPEKTAGIRTAVEMASLLSSLDHHYRALFEQEMRVVQDLGFRRISVNGFQDRIGKSCFLVRLGRHSGAEAVTIDGYRNITIMQGRGQRSKTLPHATTLWLASETARPTSGSGLIPFGWAVLEVLPLDATKGLFTRPAERITGIPSSGDESPRERPSPTERPAPKVAPERFTWQGATLTYNPGNKTLVATYQNKKAELRIGDERSLVPEKLHKLFFEKRKGVKVHITVEVLGNAFTIVSIQEA